MNNTIISKTKAEIQAEIENLLTQLLILEAQENTQDNNLLHKLSKTARATTDKITTKAISNTFKHIDKVLVNSKPRKHKYLINQSNQPLSFESEFGTVRTSRTLFIDKKTKETTYLADNIFSITPHINTTTGIDIEILNNVINLSYNKSLPYYYYSKLTSTTVMNKLHDLKNIPTPADAPPPLIKQVIDTLYIEADEDHIALQDGRNVEGRLVYVHEGKNHKGELINIKYFGGLKNSHDIWEEVITYLYNTYNLNKIKTIYLSGDGARWIKNGLEWIPNAVFVLDKFHRNNTIKRIALGVKGAENALYCALKQNKKQDFINITDELITLASTKNKKYDIKKYSKYLLNHWHTYEYYDKPNYIGCSAEGHISNILSYRLSSRPMAWSEKGVNTMIQLLLYIKNGGNIETLILQHKENKLSDAYKAIRKEAQYLIAC